MGHLQVSVDDDDGGAKEDTPLLLAVEMMVGQAEVGSHLWEATY